MPRSWTPRMLQLLIIWGFVGSRAAPLGSSVVNSCEDQPLCSTLPPEDACKEELIQKLCPVMCDTCPEGTMKESKPPSCEPECQNGGKCISENVCECLIGYTGSFCEEPVCKAMCQNGGSCIAPDSCYCKPEYNGDYCQYSMCSNMCQNGGSCIAPNTCECLPGYSGDQCQNAMCTETCHNGGTCIGPENCSCSPGFTGALCQNVIVCEDHPLCSSMTEDDCKDVLVKSKCQKFCKLCESSHTNGHQCNEHCSSVFDPVCGTDGITYDNFCLLELVACWSPEVILTKEHDGQCTKNCNANCEPTFNPVCGTDGKTYENFCQLTISACWSPEKKIQRAYMGECKSIEAKESRVGERSLAPIFSHPYLNHCHEGYERVGKQCILKSEKSLSWIAAKETCEKQNSMLMEVRDQEIDIYLDNQACKHPFVLVRDGCVWIPHDKKNWGSAKTFCEDNGASLLVPKGNLDIEDLGTWIKESRNIDEIDSNCFGGIGHSYSGKQSVTRDGITCQRWDVQKPHDHTNGLSKFSKLPNPENYCRNPDSGLEPWCYTIDKNIRWQYCGIPICNACEDTWPTNLCMDGVRIKNPDGTMTNVGGCSCSEIKSLGQCDDPQYGHGYCRKTCGHCVLKLVNFNGVGTAHSTTMYAGYGGFPPEKAFDGNRNTYWVSDLDKTYPQSIWFEFTNPIVVVKFAFRSTDLDRETVDYGPTEYEFFFSDGPDCSQSSTWVTIYTDNSGVPFTIENERKEVNIPTNKDAHKCYGFKVNKIHKVHDNGIVVTMSDIQFWEIMPSLASPATITQDDQSFWIGGETTSKTWLTGDTISSVWKKGEPDNGECVHIELGVNDAHVIGDMDCSHSHLFVCRRNPTNYWVGATDTWAEDACPEGSPKVGGQCVYISESRLVWSEAKETCENMNGRLFQPRNDKSILEYHRKNYGGGCIGGISIGHQCLTFSDEALTWDDAASACSLNGGRLSSLTEPADVLAYTIKHYRGVQFWAGGSDTAKEGNWVWLSGEPFNNFPWGRGQPDNGGEVQDCLVVGWSNTYDDQQCNSKKRYICEADNTIWLGASDLNVESLGWSEPINACIVGNNDRTLDAATIEICKEKCIKETGFLCKSIEYNKNSCQLSSLKSTSTKFGKPCYIDGWIFSERLDLRWSKSIDACIQDNNDKILTISTMNICKEKCIEETDFVCRSIEFSRGSKTCRMSSKRSISQNIKWNKPCKVEGFVFSERLEGTWTWNSGATVKEPYLSAVTKVDGLDDCMAIGPNGFTSMRCLAHNLFMCDLSHYVNEWRWVSGVKVPDEFSWSQQSDGTLDEQCMNYPILESYAAQSCNMKKPYLCEDKCPLSNTKVADQCLYISTDRVPWQAANQHCKEMNGELLQPHDRNLILKYHQNNWSPLNSYYGPQAKIWSDADCTPIGLHSGKSAAECKDLCDTTAGCSAINYKENFCDLRKCGSLVPKPKQDLSPWVGYSKVTSPARYSGPYDKRWTDAQCRMISVFEEKAFKSLSECKMECDKTPKCTVIHHSDLKKRCVLRECPLPIPIPLSPSPNLKGYAKTLDFVCEKENIIGSKCLIFSPDQKTWNDARDACSEIKGAHLLTLSHPALVKKFVVEKLGADTFWTGGNDLELEGNWVWATGEPFKNFPWPVQAPEKEENQDCLLIGQNGYFDKVECFKTHRYICEMDLTFWIGASYTDGNWLWNTGTPLEAQYQTDVGTTKSQNCLALGHKGIDGIDCTTHNFYMCDLSKAYTRAIQEIDFRSIGGGAKATSVWSQHWHPINAFNGNNYGWHNNHESSLPQVLWYEFRVAESIRRFSFRSRTDNTKPELYGPSKYIFWGSNGVDCSVEATWNILFEDFSGTPFDAENTPKEEDINNINFYRCYGFKVLESKAGSATAISNVRMYLTPLGRPCVVGKDSYPSGMLFNENCMKFRCNDGRFYSEFEYNADCGICSARNDPHFQNFDGVKFDWHGHQTYIMASEGCEKCPDTYISAKFHDCASGLPWATCIDTTHFRIDSGPEVTIFKKNIVTETIVNVDGYNQTIGASKNQELQILVGPDGSRVPYLAWHAHNCVHVMGVQNGGFMLKYCGWSMKIFAYPHLQGNLCGLCGTWSEDDRLTFRNGTQILPPPKKGNWAKKRVDKRFGSHWEVKKGSCKERVELGTGEYNEDCRCHPIKDCPISVPNMDCSNEEAYCCKTVTDDPPCQLNEEQKNKLFKDCKDALQDAKKDNQEPDEHFLENCAFDQCVAKRAPDPVAVRKLFLRFSRTQVVHEEEDDEATIVYKPPRCPKPYKFVKPYCYYKAPVPSGTLNWQEALKRCYDMGGVLAEPRDVSHFRNFLKGEISKTETQSIWLGGTSKIHTEWRWVSGTPLDKSIIQVNGEGKCMRIRISADKNFFITNGRCESKFNFICIYKAGGHICPLGCLNGGKCIGQYKCQCEAGWRGPTCEKPSIDKCAAHLTAGCKKEIICGSDEMTYKDSCKFAEAKCRNPDLKRVTCDQGSELCGGVKLGSQCLSFSTIILTWHEAAKNCQDRGGRLAVVIDPKRVLKYIQTLGEVYFWVGGSDSLTEGKWIWTTGAEIVDVPWSPNNNEDLDCLLAFSSTAYTGFNNDNCNLKKRFICEVGPCDFMCTKEYKPICDNYGITHDNFCMFKKYYCNYKKVPTYKDGVCECEKVCSEDSNPVCDKKGRKYDNKCFFYNAWCKDNSLQLAVCKAPCPVYVHCGCGTGFQLKKITQPSTGCEICNCEPCPEPMCVCEFGFRPTTVLGENGCPSCVCDICPIRECNCNIGFLKKILINPQTNCEECTCECNDGVICRNWYELIGITAVFYESITPVFKEMILQNFCSGVNNIQCPKLCSRCPDSDCRKACPRNYNPVCGSNGITYNNQCELENAQCDNSFIAKIPCDCDKPCTEEYMPVCGNNGKMYGNRCLFNNAWCKHNGLYIVTCSKDHCPQVDCLCDHGFETVIHTDAITGCPTCRCACEKLCHERFEPVCGSDGLTYDNLCKLQNAKCKNNELSIAKCREIIDPCPLLMCGCAPGYMTIHSEDSQGCQICRCEKCPQVDCDCVGGVADLALDSDGCPTICLCKTCPLMVCDCLEGFTTKQIIDHQTGCEKCTCVCEDAEQCTNLYPNCRDENVQRICPKKCGVCSDCLRICTEEYRPVCGSDGITYINQCAFDNAVCKNSKLKEIVCNCVKRCTKIYAPVCGSDGKTYDNDCFFSNAWCRDNSLTRVPCRTDLCPLMQCRCAHGYTVVTYVDDDGCSKCRCVPCPVLRCGCPPGQTIIHTTDLQGCQTCECVPCPEPLCECGSGFEIVRTLGTNGCPGCRCEKCPPVICNCRSGTLQKKIMDLTTGCSRCECHCTKVCSKEYIPVCGSDGHTYPNRCMFENARCENSKLTEVICECGMKICPKIYSPVCSSDGRTFDNACFFQNAWCRNNALYMVPCRDDNCAAVYCRCSYGYISVNYIDNGCPKCRCERCPKIACDCQPGTIMNEKIDPNTGCIGCECLLCPTPMCACMNPAEMIVETINPVTGCPGCSCVCKDNAMCNLYGGLEKFWCRLSSIRESCPCLCGKSEPCPIPICICPLGEILVDAKDPSTGCTICNCRDECKSLTPAGYWIDVHFQSSGCPPDSRPINNLRKPGHLCCQANDVIIDLCSTPNDAICPTAIICASDGHKYSGCKFNEAKCRNPHLMQVPCTEGCIQICPKDYNPICASNRVEYSNRCMFNNAKCKNPSLIEVDCLKSGCQDASACENLRIVADSACMEPIIQQTCPAMCDMCIGGLDECTSLNPSGFWISMHYNSPGCPTGTLAVERVFKAGGICCQPISITEELDVCQSLKPAGFWIGVYLNSPGCPSGSLPVESVSRSGGLCCQPITNTPGLNDCTSLQPAGFFVSVNGKPPGCPPGSLPVEIASRVGGLCCQPIRNTPGTCSDGCHNGGTCIGHNECVCSFGWTGISCEMTTTVINFNHTMFIDNLIGDIGSLTEITWRDDLRCGPEFPCKNGQPATCNANSDYPCCSPCGWCGNTRLHCLCRECLDFSKRAHDHSIAIAIKGLQSICHAGESCDSTYSTLLNLVEQQRQNIRSLELQNSRKNMTLKVLEFDYQQLIVKLEQLMGLKSKCHPPFSHIEASDECVYFSIEHKKWTDADIYCKSQNSQLYIPDSYTDTGSYMLINSFGLTNEPFIGASNSGPNRPFTWVDDKALSNSDFFLPPDISQRNCAVFRPIINKLKAVDCEQPRPFICKKNKS